MGTYLFLAVGPYRLVLARLATGTTPTRMCWMRRPDLGTFGPVNVKAQGPQISNVGTSDVEVRRSHSTRMRPGKEKHQAFVQPNDTRQFGQALGLSALIFWPSAAFPTRYIEVSCSKLLKWQVFAGFLTTPKVSWVCPFFRGPSQLVFCHFGMGQNFHHQDMDHRF